MGPTKGVCSGLYTRYARLSVKGQGAAGDGHNLPDCHTFALLLVRDVAALTVLVHLPEVLALAPLGSCLGSFRFLPWLISWGYRYGSFQKMGGVLVWGP